MYNERVFVYRCTGVPLDILASKVRMDGGNVDAGVVAGFFLDLGNHWGCLRDVVGPAHLRREEGAISIQIASSIHQKHTSLDGS